MQKNKLIQKEAKNLVREYKKNHERGEFRNKLGRIWWPIWNRIVVPGASLCGILSGSFVGLAFGATLWATSHPITKGFSVNVQNIAIKNAGVFGRFLKQRKIPYEMRREAVVEYLKQSGAWFYNKKWMKENQESIDKMAEGQKGEIIHNFVAHMEYNLTREKNAREKKKKAPPTLREKLASYKQAYNSYIREKQQMKR
ncbi:MAG: hypothetical protein IKQ99_00885 [Alphaproteobacteria bacterium]|nr:hypothetical protein [Alphaproteobacteria bacterium]